MSVTIVVIEDQEAHSQQIVESLSSYPEYEISGIAPNGEQGLDIIQSIRPQVILLDWYMPVLDGIGFLHRIKCLDLGYNPIIIVCTSDTSDKTNRIIRDQGASHVMIKPFSPISFMAFTEYVLAQRKECEAEDSEDEHSPEMGVTYRSYSPSYNAEIEKKIFDLVAYAGAPVNMKGSAYLRSALALCVSDRALTASFTKGLYREVGRIHNRESASVERSLRLLIDKMWELHREEQNEILASFKEKPHPSKLILLLLERVGQEIK